jgi:hypothetical protein
MTNRPRYNFEGVWHNSNLCARMVALSAFAFVASGCGATPDAASAQPQDPVGEVSSELTGALVGEWTDFSGTVHVRLYAPKPRHLVNLYPCAQPIAPDSFLRVWVAHRSAMKRAIRRSTSASMSA